MKLSTLFTINAIIAAVFGISFVLIPATMLSIYGITLSPAGVVLARLLGAEFLSYSALTWFARYLKETETQRIIILGCLIGFGIGLIVALMGQLTGVFNLLGWSNIIVYLLFTLGYGYFYFTKPISSEQ